MTDLWDGFWFNSVRGNFSKAQHLSRNYSLATKVTGYLELCGGDSEG